VYPGGVGMNDAQIERILKNTKFSMEMEGFTIDEALEDIGRKVLTGEINRKDYIESINQKARRYAGVS